MDRKRNKADIVYDMLKIIQEKGGQIKKTHLMYKANLSHKQLKLYLQELLDSGLINNNSSKKENFIEITSKGKNFSVKYIQLKEFERTFGL